MDLGVYTKKKEIRRRVISWEMFSSLNQRYAADEASFAARDSSSDW